MEKVEEVQFDLFCDECGRKIRVMSIADGLCNLCRAEKIETGEFNSFEED